MEGAERGGRAARGAAPEAAAAEEAPAGAGPLAALAAICAYDPRDRAVAIVPELALAAPPLGCSEGAGHSAVLTAQGEVVCAAGISEMLPMLVVGVTPPCEGLMTARLPWPAAAVSCGFKFFVALRRSGGAVCSWGWNSRGRLGRTGSSYALPTPVSGLPAADPVVLLEAGNSFVIVLTESGEAYGWGSNHFNQLGTAIGTEYWAPTRIAALSGRGLVRIACGVMFAVGETRDGVLLGWGNLSQAVREPGALCPAAGRVAFPLRSLAAGGNSAAAADAVGALWCRWEGMREVVLVELQPGERVVRVACAGFQPLGPGHELMGTVVALTAEGRLWDCRQDAPSRSISAASPQLPLGLLPHGGAQAGRVLLVPDPSCGVKRCRLLLLAAGRRELLPKGGMPRAALVPFLVDEDFIFDSMEDSD